MVNPNAEIIRSRVNQRGATQQVSIEQLGKNLSEEVEEMMTKYYHIDSVYRISFIGFSLGGLII